MLHLSYNKNANSLVLSCLFYERFFLGEAGNQVLILPLPSNCLRSFGEATYLVWSGPFDGVECWVSTSP